MTELTMKHGRHPNFWFGLYTQDDSRALPVWEAVQECKTVQEADEALRGMGLEFVEERRSVSSPDLYYANDEGLLVNVYMFLRSELTINVKEHDSKSVEDLKRFWKSWDDMPRLIEEYR